MSMSALILALLLEGGTPIPATCGTTNVEALRAEMGLACKAGPVILADAFQEGDRLTFIVRYNFDWTGRRGNQDIFHRDMSALQLRAATLVRERLYKLLPTGRFTFIMQDKNGSELARFEFEGEPGSAPPKVTFNLNVGAK